MNVCRGPKEYDVARTYVLLTENNTEAKAVGKKYLELMEMSFLQIEPFLGAIQFCRRKEKLQEKKEMNMELKNGKEY